MVQKNPGTSAAEAPLNPWDRLTEPLGFDRTQVKNHCSGATTSKFSHLRINARLVIRLQYLHIVSSIISVQLINLEEQSQGVTMIFSEGNESISYRKLFHRERLGRRRYVREVPGKGWNRRSMERLVNNIRTTWSACGKNLGVTDSQTPPLWK